MNPANDNGSPAAFRELCRLLGNAERRARDDLSNRFVRAGRGWRELPASSPKRQRLEAAYALATDALEAAQGRCAHPETHRFAPEFCGICYARVLTDIASHRQWAEFRKAT